MNVTPPVSPSKLPISNTVNRSTPASRRQLPPGLAAATPIDPLVGRHVVDECSTLGEHDHLGPGPHGDEARVRGTTRDRSPRVGDGVVRRTVAQRHRVVAGRRVAAHRAGGHDHLRAGPHRGRPPRRQWRLAITRHVSVTGLYAAPSATSVRSSVSVVSPAPDDPLAAAPHRRGPLPGGDRRAGKLSPCVGWGRRHVRHSPRCRSATPTARCPSRRPVTCR